MPLKLVTALVSATVLLLNLVLAQRSHAGIFAPDNGIVRLTVSLLIANAMVWFSQQADWQASTRFQLCVAGWIWILVQLGLAIYVLHTGSA